MVRSSDDTGGDSRPATQTIFMVPLQEPVRRRAFQCCNCILQNAECVVFGLISICGIIRTDVVPANRLQRNVPLRRSTIPWRTGFPRFESNLLRIRSETKYAVFVEQKLNVSDRVLGDHRVMPVRLVPVSSGKSIKLDKPVLLIGRNPDCDVILKQSRKVSRTHCLIACVENTIVVRDLGSTNGVWLNSQRVERDARLSIGDELSVADVRYNLVRVEKSNGLKTAADEEVPRAKSRKKKVRDAAAPDQQRAQPLDAGQPVPVAIPDEEDSFVVEASAPRLPRVTPEALKAAIDDSVGDSNRSRKSPDESLPELAEAPLELEDSLPELDNSLAELDEALSELGEAPPDIAAALPDLEDDSDEIFSLDLPEPLDMDDDEPIAGGNVERDDSSYDAPIIPLDD
jgi:hypothetical protein